jgi:hypothetical protein
VEWEEVAWGQFGDQQIEFLPHLIFFLLSRNNIMAIRIIEDKLVYYNNARTFAGILNKFVFISIFIYVLVNEWTMPLSSVEYYNTTSYPMFALFASMGLLFLVAAFIGRPNRTQGQISLISTISSLTYGLVIILLPTTTVLGAEVLFLLPLGFLNHLIFFNDESFELEFSNEGLFCRKGGILPGFSQRYVPIRDMQNLSLKASRGLMFAGYEIKIKKTDVRRPLLNLRVNRADKSDPTEWITAKEFFRNNLDKLGYVLETVKGSDGLIPQQYGIKKAGKGPS